MRCTFTLLPSDGDLSAGRHVAAERHASARARDRHLAAAGLPHPALSATALSTARCLGCFAISLRRNSSGSCAGRLGKLVHEAFEIDGVLVDVHAAPEARRDVRVAHGMVDQHVGDRVAERRFGSAGIETLERRRVGARSAAPAGAPRPGSTGRRCARAARSGCCPCPTPPCSLHCVTGWYQPWIMSSSRVHRSLTGVPGICLAMSTAWRM